MDSAAFEDTVFLLTIRIRMVRDTMRLNPPGALFMDRCLGDIAFIDDVLSALAEQATAEIEARRKADGAPASGEGEDSVPPPLPAATVSALDYAADTEWQFSQLLAEFLLESNAFSINAPAQVRAKIVSLRGGSNTRRKAFENIGGPSQGGLEEIAVGPTELSLLFGGP